MVVSSETSCIQRINEKLYSGHQGSSDPPEKPGISSQSSDGDADMVVDMKDLLLVCSQLGLGSLGKTLKHKHALEGFWFKMLS